MQQRLLLGTPIEFPPDAPEEQRRVEAAWIIAAIRAGQPVRMANAIIVGDLILPHHEVSREFELTDCEVRGGVDFSYATFARGLRFIGTAGQQKMRLRSFMDFEGATFKGRVVLTRAIFESGADFTEASFQATFEADEAVFGTQTDHEALFQGAEFRKLAWFRKTRFAGPAVFIGMKVGGQAEFTGALFAQKAAFDRAEIAGSAFFRVQEGQRTVFQGEARFVGMKVGGQAVFSGAHFVQEAAFDGADVAGDAFFRVQDGQRTEFAGEARFHGMKVGGQAVFSGARFAQKAGFDGAGIAGGAFFRVQDGQRTEFEGEASFLGTKVAGRAVFIRAAFRNGVFFQHTQFSREAFFDRCEQLSADHQASFLAAQFRSVASFRGARFAGLVSFDHASFQQEANLIGAQFSSKVSLREATFTTLNLGPVLPTSVDLFGCTYRRLLGADGCQLLERQQPYDGQPYEQLERVYRSEGNDEAADDVFFARKWREEREIPWRRFHRRLPRALWRWVAGYGVRTWRVAFWIAAVLALGFSLFLSAGSVIPADKAPEPIRSQCATGRPCQLSSTQAAAASFRLFLPVDVPSGRYWEPSEVRVSASVPLLTFSAYATVHHLLGWLLVPILVGTFTRYLQRRLG